MSFIKKKIITNSASRINLLASHYEAQNYLAIGVKQGVSFLNINMSHKVIVNPDFHFDPKEYEAPGCCFFQTTSDEFFAALASRSADETPLTSNRSGAKLTFDIIFIDGLHTFEQSFRDFENSLRYSHENTIWLLDDTIPCDPYSAFPDQNQSLAFRRAAGLPGRPWHGDVFKTVFAIHDRYLEFSYCTLMGGNPQTVIWRHSSEAEKRSPAFSSLEEIACLDYFGMLKHAALLMPVKDAALLDLVEMALEPIKYGSSDTWKKLAYKKFKGAHDMPQKTNEKTKQPLFPIGEKDQGTAETLKTLKGLCKKLQTRIKRLEQRQEVHDNAQAKLNRLYNSFSWRLTAPLRALGRGFKALK